MKKILAILSLLFALIMQSCIVAGPEHRHHWHHHDAVIIEERH